MLILKSTRKVLILLFLQIISTIYKNVVFKIKLVKFKIKNKHYSKKCLNRGHRASTTSMTFPLNVPCWINLCSILFRLYSLDIGFSGFGWKNPLDWCLRSSVLHPQGVVWHLIRKTLDIRGNLLEILVFDL